MSSKKLGELVILDTCSRYSLHIIKIFLFFNISCVAASLTFMQPLMGNCQGNKTSLDVRAVQIGIWKFRFLRRGENRSTRRKTSRSKDENQQQIQPTYDAESGNRTRATLVGGQHGRQMLNHCSIPAPVWPRNSIRRATNNKYGCHGFDSKSRSEICFFASCALPFPY